MSGLKAQAVHGRKSIAAASTSEGVFSVKDFLSAGPSHFTAESVVVSSDS